MTTSTSSEPARSRWQKVKAWWRRKRVTILLYLLGVLLVFLFFAPHMVIRVGPGHSGVLWRRFGGGTVTVGNDGRPFIGRIDADERGEARTLIEQVHQKEDSADDQGFNVYPYGEGFHLIWPWDEFYTYNIRLQETSQTFGALTNDGLAVQAEVAITWKPIEADLGKLHRDIGPDYVKVLLLPTVGSCARQLIAPHPPDALYSAERIKIQEGIRDCVRNVMLSRFYPMEKRESYVIVEDVLIREVQLPQDVKDAIEEKVSQKHLAESYVYRLQRERLEADRKAIEGEGIRRFQATINSTISDGYLKWKGIDATLELAKSPNAKVVVIGAGGADGLPIILGGLDNLPGPAMPAAPLPAAPSPAAAAAAPSPSTPAVAAPIGPTAPPATGTPATTTTQVEQPSGTGQEGS